MADMRQVELGISLLVPAHVSDEEAKAIVSAAVAMAVVEMLNADEDERDECGILVELEEPERVH